MNERKSLHSPVAQNEARLEDRTKRREKKQAEGQQQPATKAHYSSEKIDMPSFLLLFLSFFSFCFSITSFSSSSLYQLHTAVTPAFDRSLSPFRRSSFPSFLYPFSYSLAPFSSQDNHFACRPPTTISFRPFVWMTDCLSEWLSSSCQEPRKKEERKGRLGEKKRNCPLEEIYASLV